MKQAREAMLINGAPNIQGFVSRDIIIFWSVTQEAGVRDQKVEIAAGTFFPK